MIEPWTGKLVGRMHIERIRVEDLAKELGCTKGYVSMILNGKRKPPDARQKLEQAVERIIERRKEKNGTF